MREYVYVMRESKMAPRNGVVASSLNEDRRDIFRVAENAASRREDFAAPLRDEDGVLEL